MKIKPDPDMILNPLRKLMLQWKVDPPALKFWPKKGTRIKVWRKRHGLIRIHGNENVSYTKEGSSIHALEKEASLQE
jgi:hypothetical protein